MYIYTYHQVQSVQYISPYARPSTHHRAYVGWNKSLPAYFLDIYAHTMAHCGFDIRGRRFANKVKKRKVKRKGKPKVKAKQTLSLSFLRLLDEADSSDESASSDSSRDSEDDVGTFVRCHCCVRTSQGPFMKRSLHTCTLKSQFK